MCDVAAYSPVTVQTQCKPHQVMWLTPVLQPRHNVQYVSSGDVVAYSCFTAQTQCKPHQVTLWLTPLLLPRHNVCLIR